MKILFALTLANFLPSGRAERYGDAFGNLPSYQLLPPLREQAKIQDAWLAERKASIPKLMKKYRVDAWLVRLMTLVSQSNS
jgi:hypothetical protein